MRFHTYQKYSGSLFDALNIQDLLERLADFLLQSGFEGGPHYHPWWGWSGDDDDRSVDSLKAALLQALIESGQLTPEMLAELRGEGNDEEIQRQIAELLDQLVQRLVEEGYINTQPEVPASFAEAGTGTIDDAKEAAQHVEFNLSQKGIDFLGYRTL
ncbi:MAG TPA: hypothetical protein VK928_10745, partial [Longimicrobiales bacterium]|nr:hypothetical protein [Longimicrobiales bacterium]